MLHIAVMFSAISPIVFEHRAAQAIRLWVTTGFRLAIGFAVATLVYFGVLLAFVTAYKLSQPIGAAAYGVGFAVATLLAVIAGTQVSPARLTRIIIQGVCALGILFPLGVTLYFGMMGAWKAIYLLYLAGAVAGGYGVARLTSGARHAPRLRPI
jgi:hypothetical protein